MFLFLKSKFVKYLFNDNGRQTRVLLVKTLLTKEIYELRNANFLCIRFAAIILLFLLKIPTVTCERIRDSSLAFVWVKTECRTFFHKQCGKKFCE